MAKINFTAEHKGRLLELASSMLFSGNVIKGLIGSELNIYDLIHNTTVNTLVTINGNLKKEIDRLTNLDEWSMTPYQQQKLSATKETQELVNLLIGYKKYTEQVNAEKAKVADLKAKYKELQASTMSPEDQLKALAAEITALGGEIEDKPAEETATAQA